MLKYDASVGARTLDRLAVYQDFSRGREIDTLQNAEQRALSAAARADDADELALFDRKADVPQGCKAVLLLGIVNR